MFFKFTPPKSVFLSFKGFRTLEDIRAKATLTHTLRIGLKHYDDFLDRMPRSEAAAIETTVRNRLHRIPRSRHVVTPTVPRGAVITES